MRLIGFLFALLFSNVTCASKKETFSTFEDLYPKSVSETPLKLNDESYSKYTSKPRDYGVVVLLTALESRFGCALCQNFQPDWELLAKTWLKGDTNRENRLIFGTLDFVNGRNAFQAVSVLITKMVAPQDELTCCTVDASDGACSSIVSAYHRTKCKA